MSERREAEAGGTICQTRVEQPDGIRGESMRVHQARHRSQKTELLNATT